ncbi:MAG TPA: hypothetical protein VGL23_09250 [Chloroflexota bacterium]
MKIESVRTFLVNADEAECAKHPPKRVEDYEYRLRTPDQIQQDRA